jgi:Mor family transcriptional regulator
MKNLKRYHQPDIVGMLLKEVRAALGTTVFPGELERAIERRARIEWGGQEVYVKKSGRDPDERALAIRGEYNGANGRALREKWGLGRAQFYKILKGA